ncbi:MAG: extracellular solute-binding protein [Patescibacteria group bacterium]|nr:extracellular solute-binding protein [Patescibacteria group bacterium]
MKKIQKFLVFVLVLSMTFGISGCLREKAPAQKKVLKSVDLVYYKMFDDEDAISPIIQDYQAKNPGVRVHYKKFTDFEEYMETIVNELAEGEGPDIFSVQNTWFTGNLKKLIPMPSAYATSNDFDQTYVDVAAQDMIHADEVGVPRIYGIPMTIDTLAIFYNKDHYSDRVPGVGRPGTTWSELGEHVAELTEEDDSYEHFEVAGIAMGRADNITRAVDILYLLMMQLGTVFYDDKLEHATFATSAKEALEYFISFADEESDHYSWNKYISDPESEEKEITTFAKGKTSMIIGYSYTYDQILNEIARLKKNGEDAISPSAIRVAPMPQMSNAATDKRITYASYFAETVSRTSKNPEEAWNFLIHLGSKESLQKYNDATKKPTSRRDLIEDQKLDPTYGVFVNQIGHAESFPIFNYHKYKEIFTDAIQEALATSNVTTALKAAEAKIDKLIPQKPLFIKQEPDETETAT